MIVDDIEDQSDVRRNGQAIHLMFSFDRALNSSCWVYFKAMDVMNNNVVMDFEKKFKVLQIYIEEMQNLHVGQGLDIYWHNELKPELMDLDHYLYMCSQKTGGLLRMGVRMLAIMNDWDENFTGICIQILEKLGIMFQIVDDVLNLEDNKISTSKGLIGEDIHEGKVTYMIILSMKNLEKADSDR